MVLFVEVGGRGWCSAWWRWCSFAPRELFLYFVYRPLVHSRALPVTPRRPCSLASASDTPYGGKFGYSTLADGAQKEVDVLALPGGGTVDLGGDMEAALNGDDSSSSLEEDNSAPVSLSIKNIKHFLYSLPSSLEARWKCASRLQQRA